MFHPCFLGFALGISYRCDIRSRTELTANVCSDMIETLVRAKGHCYSAGGWPSSSKGGDAYADYSDIPCVRFHLHIKNYEKKQQPPLGQVTVEALSSLTSSKRGQPLVAVLLFSPSLYSQFIFLSMFNAVTLMSEIFSKGFRLKSSTSKDARIQYQQLARYIWLLQENGTHLPQEITKHLKNDIWELRPGNNRVFYFFFKDDTYVLLHHFRKKSQKTPQREIDRAISEMHDYLPRKEK